MRGFSIALRAELYRALHTRSLWLSLLMLVLVAAGYVLLGHLSELAGLRSQASSDLESAGGGWVHFVDAWRFTLSIACLLLLIQGARSIAMDRSSGVLRLGLCRASSRSAVALARAAVAWPMILIAFACTGISAFLASRAFYDFGPLIEDGYELMSAGELRSELIDASLAILLPLAAMHAYALMASSLAKRSINALSFVLASLLCFDLFKGFLGQPIVGVFASFAPTFSDTSALSQMSGVAAGFSDMGYDPTLLGLSHLVPVPYIVLCLAIACLATARRSA